MISISALARKAGVAQSTVTTWMKNNGFADTQILQQAMALDPLNELLAINFAQNLSSRGDYQAGKDLLQGLVSLRPDSATLLRIISGHAMKSGELVAAWRYASQSYDLEPESPVVIETLASAWESVGVIDKAESLLLEGLEIAGDNSGLRNYYFFLLLRQGRLEKAASMIQEQYGESVEGLPEQHQQHYYFQKGMISLVAGDKDTAMDFIDQAIGDETDQTWDRKQIFFLTLSSALKRGAGDTDMAEQRLVNAERAVRRARINGVDDADIYYTESSIHALRGDSQAALESLQLAYERGFRGIWMLKIDLRLESVRDEPRFVAIEEKINRDIAQARSEVESSTFAVR